MGSCSVRGGSSEWSISNDKVSPGCRCPTDWRLFQGRRTGVWRGECESRAAADHRRRAECRPEKGVIKEAGRLKLNPPPADRGNGLVATFTQNPTAWLTSTTRRLNEWISLPETLSTCFKAFSSSFLRDARAQVSQVKVTSCHPRI